MPNTKTILSSAALIAELLGEDEAVMAMAKMVYPVIAPEKAVCPYVVYRRAKVLSRPEKSPVGHADTAIVEVLCCGATYAQSVELAEAVKSALDGTQGVSADGFLRMRSCFLSDASEGWEQDTYVQTLTFTVRIN